MSAPNGSRFRVVISQRVLDNLKSLHQRAKPRGQGPKFLSALKKIIAILEERPLDFGEPRFNLRHLKLEVRLAIVPPLVVVYGAHTEKALVFVREFLLLPGSPF